jgi:hypothetical protein
MNHIHINLGGWLFLPGFLPKVVGGEKLKHPSDSPQAGRFGPARVHVWNGIFFLVHWFYLDFFHVFCLHVMIQKWWMVHA